jgi:hypothetical protein
MSIGKNAIKRVQNNGYSNVKTSAPDMENSTQIPTPVEVAEAVTQKKPAKKAPAKKTAAKKAPVKKAEKVEKKAAMAGVQLGEDLPYYLL